MPIVLLNHVTHQMPNNEGSYINNSIKYIISFPSQETYLASLIGKHSILWRGWMYEEAGILTICHGWHREMYSFFLPKIYSKNSG